jgi:tetratricopeptide (TPR) repeat protein
MRYPLGRLATFAILTAVSLRAASWSDQVNRGNLQLQRGVYGQAVEEYQAALPLANLPVQRGVTLFSLAVVYQLLADFGASERCYKEALSLFRAERDYEKLALSLSGLGQVYRAEHRLDDALDTERNAFLALKRIGMDKTRDAAFVLGITGAILGELNRLYAGQRSIEAAQAILEKTVGPDAPEFATNLNRLGVIALARKRPGEAEGLLTRALQIRQAHFGSRHPLVANTLLTLSFVYLEQRRYGEADGSCRQALETMRDFLPANHPTLITGSMQLATIAHRSGDFAAATGILAASIAGLEAHPSTITGEYVQLVSLYAKYLGDAGDKQEARHFRLEARQMGQQFSRTSLARSTVSVSELEAGVFR